MLSTRRVWGERIRARRNELGLRLREVADAAGCDVSHLSRIENASRGMSDALKARLAVALQTDPDELFAWPESRAA